MGDRSGAFLLSGEGWRALESAPAVRGAMLVRVVAGGCAYYLSSSDVTVRDGNGEEVLFRGALAEMLEIEDSVDYVGAAAPARAMSFRASAAHLPFVELRANGVILQNSDVDVWWLPLAEGLEFTLEQADHVLGGKLRNPVYDEEAGLCSFEVEDLRLEGDSLFPPEVMSTDGISNLDDEAVGKPYTVIIGSVARVPISLHGGVGSAVIAYDPNDDFDAAAVTAVYEGDATNPPSIDVQGREQDDLGAYYWNLDFDVSPAGKDLTADVDGPEFSNPVDVISYLLQNFSVHAEDVDFDSLAALRPMFSSVEMGLAFNQQVDGGAIAAVQRVVSQVPIFAYPRSGMLTFGHRFWDRSVVRYLKTDRDLMRKIDLPSETSHLDVVNDFVVRYAVSGFRGDFTGVVKRSPSSNMDCMRSSEWYGRRSSDPVDIPDVRNENGANLVADWHVETHSRVRVLASYEARVGSVAGLSLWDTVRVEDSWEGWDHAPLFKVVRIRKGDSQTMGLGLVSVDDALVVYRGA